MQHAMKYLIYILVWGVWSSPAVQSGYTTNGNVVTIQLDDDANTKFMQIHVLGPDIVRVVAAPYKEFAEDESLIVVPQDEHYDDFTVSEDDELVAISTPELKVKVNKTSGAVEFLDDDDNAILRERLGGGKVYTASSEQGLYSVQQVFNSPDDEAFYGLGQHQHG